MQVPGVYVRVRSAKRAITVFVGKCRSLENGIGKRENVYIYRHLVAHSPERVGVGAVSLSLPDIHVTHKHGHSTYRKQSPAITYRTIE